MNTYNDRDAFVGSQLFKSSVGIVLLRVISLCFTFLNSLLLARLLGADGYGIYAYSLAWIGFLLVPSVLGFDQLLIREISVQKIKLEWSLMRGLIKFSHKALFSFSLFIAVIAFFINLGLEKSSDTTFIYTFSFALTLLPLSVLITIKRSVLIGLNKVVLGHIPEMLIKPCSLFVCLSSIYFVGVGINFSSTTAMGVTVFVSLISFFTAFLILNRESPKQIYETLPVYNVKSWIKSSFPLLLIGGMLVINFQADIIMLGAIKGPKMTGIYSIASACAGLITFVLISVNAALAPSIASLYAEGNMSKLQQKVTISARLIILLSLPIAIILILFGKVFLSFFGANFIYGLNSLRILCVGQIINISAGSVGLLLNMTGYERIAAIGFGIGAISNIILNAFLIPVLGMEGAAVSSAISMVLWNLVLAVLVYKHLEIHSTALGRLSYIVKRK